MNWHYGYIILCHLLPSVYLNSACSTQTNLCHTHTAQSTAVSSSLSVLSFSFCPSFLSLPAYLPLEGAHDGAEGKHDLWGKNWGLSLQRVEVSLSFLASLSPLYTSRQAKSCSFWRKDDKVVWKGSLTSMKKMLTLFYLGPFDFTEMQKIICPNSAPTESPNFLKENYKSRLCLHCPPKMIIFWSIKSATFKWSPFVVFGI